MRKCVRLTTVGYVPILRSIIDGGATWLTLAEKHSIHRTTAQKMVNDLRDMRAVHVAAWQTRSVGYRVEHTPVLAWGPGDDAPWPGKTGAPRPHRRRRPPVELLSLVRSLEALQEDSWHKLGLSVHMGIGHKLARQMIDALHEHRMVFIEEYEERSIGGAGFPLWRYGIDHDDAKKPRRKGKKAINREAMKRRHKRERQVRILHALVKPAANDSHTEVAA